MPGYARNSDQTLLGWVDAGMPALVPRSGCIVYAEVGGQVITGLSDGEGMAGGGYVVSFGLRPDNPYYVAAVRKGWLWRKGSPGVMEELPGFLDSTGQLWIHGERLDRVSRIDLGSHDPIRSGIPDAAAWLWLGPGEDMGIPVGFAYRLAGTIEEFLLDRGLVDSRGNPLSYEPFAGVADEDGGIVAETYGYCPELVFPGV